MSQSSARVLTMMALASQALSVDHGWGVYSEKGLRNLSRNVYPLYSDRECARRRKQMAAGKLAWNKSGCC